MPDVTHTPELNHFYSRLGEDPLTPGDEDALRNLEALNSLIDGARDRRDENMIFHHEYREQKAAFAAAGLSEADYIASRRIDVGLDELTPGSAAEQTPPNVASEPDDSVTSLDGPAPEPGSAARDSDPAPVLYAPAPSGPPSRQPRPGERPLSRFEMMMGGRIPDGTTQLLKVG